MMKLWYHFKHKIFPTLLARLGKFLSNLLLKTCRFEVIGVDNFKTVASKEKCIIMLWHNRLALAPYIISTYAPEFNYAVLISQSRDGEILSAITESYSIGTSLRVPHNKRLEAMNQTINHINSKGDILVMTPDGPRGPRYKIKKGITHIAAQTGAKIVSISWCADKFWQLRSWDKLMIPKPFSKVYVHFSGAIESTSVDQLETALTSDTAAVCVRAQASPQ